jgi:hypothetical protein
MTNTYESKGQKSTAKIALDFLRAHPSWFIFPVIRLGKKPAVEDNLNLASNNLAVISAWHKQFPGCNWGVATVKSGIVPVDVDTKEGKAGADTLDTLTMVHGELPDTMMVRSPSGGMHFYYNAPKIRTGEWRAPALGKSGFGRDIDVPGYVLIPGCTLDNGAYVVERDVRVAEAPEWFGEYLKPKDKTGVADDGTPVVDTDQDPNVARMILYLKEGAPPCIAGQNGNITLYRVACVLKENGISELMAVDLLAEHYNVEGKCDPLWSVRSGAERDRLDVVVRNAYQYGENATGSATAEFAFGDPEDRITPEEMAELRTAWQNRDAEQTSTAFTADPLDTNEIEELGKLAVTHDRCTYRDFLFSLPDNEFIFIPSGADKLWPAGSVNLACEGPKLTDPLLADEFGTNDAAKAFATASEGWSEAESSYEADKGKRRAKTEASEAEAPVKSKAQERIERISKLLKTSPAVLRAWLLENGIFKPNKNWDAVMRMPATAAVVGDEKRRVAELTWWPGKPAVICDTLVRNGGGIIPMRGTNTFNRYRKALLKPGKFPEPKRWLDHIDLIYHDDLEHIVQWLAWRVQHPETKILHALVLGGPTRIGKDTLVYPVSHAIGPWNFKTTNAQYIMDEPRYNHYLEAVICLINEAKDYGQDDRFAFYERVKPWLGGTATGVLMVADKYVRVHPVRDVWGAIITTNFKVRGLFLPEDDARHYVAWSNRTWEDWGLSDQEKLSEEYFKPLYDWYENGGKDAVAHYLMTLPLDEAFPKAPPPKTAAWHEIVNAYTNPEKSKLADILEGMGDPPAVTVNEVGKLGRDVLDWFGASERNAIPAQFEDVGYVHQPNPNVKRGMWQVGDKRRPVTIYVRAKLKSEDRVKAAKEVFDRVRKAVAAWEANPRENVDPLS